MVAEQCDCAQSHWVAHLKIIKMVNLMLFCILYHYEKELCVPNKMHPQLGCGLGSVGFQSRIVVEDLTYG